MTDFEIFDKVPQFDKTLSCGRFWRYDGGSLNIFRILYESLFSLLVIVSSAFHGGRDIKIGHPIFFEKKSVFALS